MNYIDKASEEDVFSSVVQEEVHNYEMNLAWQFLTATNMSVFLTGKAGTGKTTFLRKLRELSPKRMVVLAPTGVAAINAQGQTIHSFFQLPLGPIPPVASTGYDTSRQYDGDKGGGRRNFAMSKDKKNLIRTLDLLVIDEISMVRCDVLDAIDAELRKYRDASKPFGGVQLLLIGDLRQLAPVAKDTEWAVLSPYYDTPYFFGSRALRQIQYVTVELQHIYRQQDQHFVNILGKIRTNQVDADVTNALNARYVPNFAPPADEDWIRLTTHNNKAQQYNDMMLQSLPGDTMKFNAEIHKNFPETIYPADAQLVLKAGAQVMFIKNDTSGRRYYNGKIGVVRGVKPIFNDMGQPTDRVGIEVYSKEDKTTVLVEQATWENTKYTIDEETKEIKETVEGTFSQYPLRLAWAITVHKSQGLTFDHAVIDINDSFAHGQVYVALSRCRTLEGMVLSQPLHLNSVITDANVNNFVERALNDAAGVGERLPELKYQYYQSLLDELFTFTQLGTDMHRLARVVENHLFSNVDLLVLLKGTEDRLTKEVVEVAVRFQMQYRQLMAQSGMRFANDPNLQQRIIAAAGYFAPKIAELLAPVMSASILKIGNKAVATQYNNALDAFALSYKVKLGTFRRIQALGRFTIQEYLRAKAKAALDDLKIEKKSDDGSSSLVTVGETSAKVKKPKEEKPKKPKKDTKLETFNLYKEGMSIEDIAKARSLSATTIEGHLAHYVTTGDLSVDTFVPRPRQQLIRAVIGSFAKAYTLTDVKSKLPDDYTFGEIRMVMADMDRT